MTQPQVEQVQNRVQVYAGMSVNSIKKNGSDGQKMMVPLFDRNNDGVLNEYEADSFNKCRFAVSNNKVTMYKKLADGKEQITEFMYDDFEKDVLHMYKGQALNHQELFLFKNDKGEHCSFRQIASYTKAVIDMIKGKVYIENANGKILGGRNIELTVKDSDVEEINISKEGTLNLENTKNKGLLWDSPTVVRTDGTAKINADVESEYEVKQEK